MIEVTTVRDLIEDVAARWHSFYGSSTQPDKILIDQKLQALNKATATAEQVNEIIGNSSWTGLACDCCGTTCCPAIVTVGEEPDYESQTARMCLACAKNACKMLEAALAQRRWGAKRSET